MAFTASSQPGIRVTVVRFNFVIGSPASNSDVVLAHRVDDGVLLLTLNRPDRLNAWTLAMEERYFGLLAEAAADPDVRAIVVTGAGRGFCAGLDADALSGVAGGTPLSEHPRRPQTFPLEIPKPIVAAVNGAAAGIGFLQALVADVRFAAAGAKFTTAFARRGLLAEHGMSWLLPRLIGHARATELLLSARVFLAEEAGDDRARAPCGRTRRAARHRDRLRARSRRPLRTVGDGGDQVPAAAPLGARARRGAARDRRPRRADPRDSRLHRRRAELRREAAHPGSRRSPRVRDCPHRYLDHDDAVRDERAVAVVHVDRRPR